MEYQTASRSDKIMGYLTVVATCVYLVWRIGFTLPVSYGILAVVLGLLLYICELISGIQAIMNYLNQIRPLPLERPEIPASQYPHVDIFIATHDEEENLLYNTINACLYLEYPDKSKVHVHLCDDGNRPEIRALAEKMGINYIDFPEPKFAKAGNMNNALTKTDSPFIAFLDADMVPRREFLMRVIPFFFLPKYKKLESGEWVERTPEEIDPDYKIGFVQTPQNFYNPDLFQYNLYAENRIPHEQMYFFRELNVSRNRHNATLMCGSNMIISRAALAEVGNFAVNNITEDHETGMKIQNAGWTTYGIPECLANGLNPPAVVNLIIQRERWGRGCMQTFYNIRPFFDSRIPLVRRLEYFCSLLYWLTFFSRFMFILAPILVAIFGLYIVECSLGELLVFWLPCYLLHMTAMKKISGKTRTVHWSNTIDTIMFPFLVVPVMLDLVGVKLKRFKVTDKSHQAHTSANRMLTLPHILLFSLSVIGIVICIVDIITNRALYNVIILFWLILNAKGLLLSIFFMLGRVNARHSYRFNVALPMELEIDGHIYSGNTIDISEGGFSAALDFPAVLDKGQTVIARIRDRIYTAEMHCSMIRVDRMQHANWVYSMKLEHIDEDNLSQYRQIIYERDPTLPETVQETIPVIEDLKVNFDRRLGKHKQFFARTLPRIMERLEARLPDGRTVFLNDFSYRYVQAYPLEPLAEGETVTLSLEPGIEMILTAPEEEIGSRNRSLFKVLNWEEWAHDPRYLAVVARWAGAEPPVPAPDRLADRSVRERGMESDGQEAWVECTPVEVQAHMA